LQVVLDKQSLEMGKYFVVDIVYQGKKGHGDFNLSSWENDFHIELMDQEKSEISSTQVELHSRYRLYPRHIGTLALPQLAYGGAITQQRSLIVSTSIRNHIDATPQIRALKPILWAGETFLVQIDMALHDQRNKLVVDDFQVAGFKIVRLKDTRIPRAKHDVIRVSWILRQVKKGTYQIELPSIQQRGRGRFRFYLPKLDVKIDPLPAYLPASVAVGKLEGHAERVELMGRQYWFIQLKHLGDFPEKLEGMSDLLDQLELGTADVRVENTFNETLGRVTRQYWIEIPQWHLLPEENLSLAYFDVLEGRLVRTELVLPMVWQIPGFAKVGLVFFLMGLFFYLGFRFDRMANKWRLAWKFRQQIRQADSARRLRALILSFYGVKRLSSCGLLMDNPELAKQLNELCFAQQTGLHFSRIKQQCVTLVEIFR